MREVGLQSVPGSRHVLLLCSLLCVLAAGATILQCVFLAHVLCGLWQGSALSGEAVWLGAFFISFAVRLALGTAQASLADRFARHASESLLHDCLAALSDMGPACVRERGAGACVANATEGIDRIQAYLSQSIPRTSALIAVPFSLGVALCSFDMLSGIIAFICFPFIIIFMQLVGHSASDESARRHARFAQMSNHFLDALRGLDTLSAFGRAKGYGKSVYAASEAFRRQVMRTLRVASLSSTVLDVFATLGLAVVAIMLGFRMVDGDVSFFPALCVLLLMPEFFMPIRAFGQGYHATLDGKTALADVQSMIASAQSGSCSVAECESVEMEPALTCALHKPGRPDIRFDEVRAGYMEGHHVLSCVTLSLAQAHIVVVTGPSGSGKSTFLDIIAGLSSPTSGTICVNGQAAETLKRPEWRSRVAFIPQTPHIFNETLRENVSLYHPSASDDEVKQALRAVGLAHLAEGSCSLDMMLGDGGRELSGGEAHRVAFARALLDPRRDVIVLDEPTEDVDMACERDLMRIIADMPPEKLIVVATHRLHWLALADLHIQIVEGRAQIAQTPSELFADDLSRDGMLQHGRMQAFPFDERLTRENDATSCMQEKRCDVTTSCRDAWTERSRAEEGKHGTGPASAKSIVSSLLHEHAGLFVCALILSVIAALCACGLMFTSGYMIAVAAALPLSALALHLPSLFVRIFGVGKPLIDYLQRLMSHDWVLRATSRLRVRLFDAVSYKRAHGHQVHAGELLTTLMEDIKATQDLFIRCVEPILRCVLLVAIISAVAFAFSAAWGCVLFLLLIASSVGLGLLARFVDKPLKSKADVLMHRFSVHLTDQVLGLRDVILSGSAHARRSDLLASYSKHAALQEKLSRRSALRAFASQMLVGVAVVVTVVWAAAAFAPATAGSAFFLGADMNSAVQALHDVAALNEQPLPANWIVAFAICLFPLIEFLLPTCDAILAASVHMDQVRHLDDIIEGAPANEPRQQERARTDSSWAEVVPSDPELAVEFSGAQIGYGNTSSPLFSRLDLSIRAGEKVYVLGRSGAGKTTLARAIAKVIPPEKGSVRTRGSVGLIEQDAYIFNKTLRENLLIACGSARDEELIEALTRVGLEGLLRRLPHGLDTVLAAGGDDISGGEARRITVARALLAGFDTVIFDEPFKGLDDECASVLSHTIAHVLKRNTVIIITHRLEGVDASKRLLFVENGHVYE